MSARLHVVGAGPVGLLLALHASRSVQVTLYCGPARIDAGSVESVPAPLMALLLENGIHPHSLGVDRFYSQRHQAWDSARPAPVDGKACAHLDRPRLTQALLERVALERRVELRPLPPGGVAALPRATLVDASGRRALAAARRWRVDGGPVARTWIQQAQLPAPQRAFRIAALPNGYVYRLASARHVVMGWCGAGEMLRAGPLQWPALLEAADAAWIGLPALSPQGWRAGKAAAAGAQWAEAADGTALLGDAAYARDTLASQGLSAGISDAWYFLAAQREGQRPLWEAHRRAQFQQHLARLLEQIERCRFAHSAFWQRYRSALVLALQSGGAPARTACLRGGRLVELPP